MRINAAAIGLASLITLGMGCGSKDKDSETSVGPSAGTTGGTTGGANTGTAGGTAGGTATTDALARMVHLMFDAGELDIYLNGGGTPINTNKFPIGGNSDADPVTYFDYIGFPTFGTAGTQYTIALRDASDVDVLTYQTTVNAQVEYTIIALGFANPPFNAVYPTMGLTVEDANNNSPSAGGHALTVFHTLGGVPDVDVYVCAAADVDADGVTDPCDVSGTASASGLTYGAWTSVIDAPAGDLIVTFTPPGTPFPLWGYEIQGAADGWSYLYVAPDAANPMGTPIALHHRHGTPNTPVMPTGWMPPGTGTGTGTATGTGTGTGSPP